jgi:hypothetical protein
MSQGLISPVVVVCAWVQAWMAWSHARMHGCHAGVHGCHGGVRGRHAGVHGGLQQWAAAVGSSSGQQQWAAAVGSSSGQQQCRNSLPHIAAAAAALLLTLWQCDECPRPLHGSVCPRAASGLLSPYGTGLFHMSRAGLYCCMASVPSASISLLCCCWGAVVWLLPCLGGLEWP